VLSVESLRKSWPGFELDVDLRLGDAEIGAVLGPSGSGKSSLLRLLAGLERPDSGRVVVDGTDVGRLPPERRGIGMVFQDHALFPARTVAGNISYGPAVAGVPRAERKRITRSLAAELGIEALLGRYPSSLSGGESQRVALARTLAAKPALVLLDEPLSSLDESMRKRLRLEIAERLRGAGAAALHVTHDVEEALAIADRLFLMRGGRIVATGLPEELFDEPPSAWAASFIGAGAVIPALSVEGSSSAPIARCFFGSLRCRATTSEIAKDGGYSVFFRPEHARVIGADAASDSTRRDTETINRFTCVVVSLYFTGRSRRAVLSLGTSDSDARIEIDIPSSTAVARGERIGIELQAAECRVLPN
jgi:ABC-type Fe3+/spermidine/putrescine transport system ATPase subunit